MKRSIAATLAAAFLCLFSLQALAWGYTGHSIVAEIAFQQLSQPAQQRIRYYIGNMSLAEAANWMDQVRSDHRFDSMKSWHYVNIPEGKEYEAADEQNVVAQLSATYAALQHRSSTGKEQVKQEILVLLHLAGDFHQPLHTGYADDKGGNKMQVQFFSSGSNLHQVWDDGIIRRSHITVQDCETLLKTLSPRQQDHIRKMDVPAWLKENRALLPAIYTIGDRKIGEDYVTAHRAVVVRQLLYAGLRLGAMLETLFDQGPEPLGVTTEPAIPSAPKGQLSPEEAASYIGQQATVCGKICSTRYMDKAHSRPTFLNMGAAYPDNPFTVVIFGEYRNAFPYQPEVYFNNQNVCVTGQISQYRGKAQMEITDTTQIQLQNP